MTNPRLRWHRVLLAAALTSGFGVTVPAQGPAPAGQRRPYPPQTSQPQASQLGTPGMSRGVEGNVPRPEAEPLRVKQLDPALEQILANWERESSKIQVLQGTHYRQEFNNVFSVEKRAKGVFYYEAPDKGRFDMQSVEIKEGQKSQKTDPNTGKPYQLASSSDQGWVCTGKEVLIINPEVKQFEVFPIPPDMQGERISQSPLPFLFGMKAQEAKQRYDMKLFGQNDQAFFIDIVPLQQMDSQNYKHARIVLSKETYVPTKVYLIDPAGSIMTEYTFVDVKVNPGRGALAVLLPFFKDADPFRPKLTGYTRVQPPDAAAQAGGGNVQPASNSVPAENGAMNRRTTNLPPQNRSTFQQ